MADQRFKPWQCIESDATNAVGEAWRLQNVVPRFGREHVLSPACWCQPELEEIWGRPTGERGGLLVHNAVH